MTVLRQNITIGICISNPTNVVILWKCLTDMPHYFINIVHTGLPKSTFRSRGKKKICTKNHVYENDWDSK